MGTYILTHLCAFIYEVLGGVDATRLLVLRRVHAFGGTNQPTNQGQQLLHCHQCVEEARHVAETSRSLYCSSRCWRRMLDIRRQHQDFVLTCLCCIMFSECGSVQALLFLACFVLSIFVGSVQDLFCLCLLPTLLPLSCDCSPPSLLWLLSSLSLVLPLSCPCPPPSLLALLSSLSLVPTSFYDLFVCIPCFICFHPIYFWERDSISKQVSQQ